MTARAKALKTTGKTTARCGVAKVPQPHGGALNAGGTRGNAGGTGRPPSELRARLRGSFDQRIAVIEAIADGDAIKHVRVPLAAVWPHVHCPRCNGHVELTSAEAASLIEVTGFESASPSDRIRAIDLTAKYGLGTQQEITGKDGEPLLGAAERRAAILALLSDAASR
jgi:hypothetical protein